MHKLLDLDLAKLCAQSEIMQVNLWIDQSKTFLDTLETPQNQLNLYKVAKTPNYNLKANYPKKHRLGLVFNLAKPPSKPSLAYFETYPKLHFKLN